MGFWGSKKEIPVTTPISAPEAKITAAIAIATATGEDNEAWLYYLSHRDARLRKPGMSIKDEYEQWMIARVNSRHPVSSSNRPT
jgi:hypothetical protein